MKTSVYLNSVLRNTITTIFLLFQFSTAAQEIDINAVYQSAMKEYELRNYKNASEKFKTITDKTDLDKVSSGKLYDGACIFSLDDRPSLSFEILNYLASNRYYSNLEHITTDSDLKKIHPYPEWNELIGKVKENVKTLPERTRQTIKTELLKAKKLLLAENDELWGESIWSEDILVLDFDNTIYSLKQLPNSLTSDSIVFYKKIPENTLGFSNAAQQYDGKEYAVVLTNYLDDNGSTIIHELFHVLQHKHLNLNGDPISYLENHDAREWLRLEYQALKNALNSINNQDGKSIIKRSAEDALLFRKSRQTKYKEFLKKEVEIETSEGLANYTGLVLSPYPNKYREAILEIDQRERAQTYTRAFPYATGPAYGLIFDYLALDWKIGLDTVYNFLDIYETAYLNEQLKLTPGAVDSARERSNYVQIHAQELRRKDEAEKLITYYSDMFVHQPTMTVLLSDSEYGRTFDMNGTVILKDHGIIYSMIKGMDNSKNNFGDFSTISGKEELGESGVLYSFDGKRFTFPIPKEINENRIIGEHYEIELNDDWEVKNVNEKGDLKIVRKEE